MGEIGGGWWNGLYLDYFLLLTFGGIPWQVRLTIIITDGEVDGTTVQKLSALTIKQERAA